MEAHPDLLVAGGTCNAYSGVGDPYLPFRELLAMLTGEVEARWAAGAIGQDQARRLWNALPAAIEALLAHGPHVMPTLVPGEALLARAEVACPGAGWLGQLRERVERGRSGADGLEQSHLFQQVSNVLQALSEDHALLLILDDLQWVDWTSAGLLFHLGRRLEGSRILIVGAYRPEELTARADGERHPLDKVLAEFKRLYGDVWLDLADVDEPQGRHFVEELLETEPNRLEEGFRQALAERAGGHPLFTVELLRAMQERGDLVRDEAGRWVEGPALDWERLPARVEGVVAERIERLGEDLRDVLTVASVEGEDFTAEVVAQVRAVEARELMRRLSGELQREHRLVRARGLLRLDARRLALYRFQHHLFQKYLYNHLDEAERAYLHEDVGTVLEALYGGQTDEVAGQLARHFLEAGATDKAAHYFGRAGELAAERYANEEALAHLGQALALLPETDRAARYGLLLAREEVYDVLGQRDAQRQDLAELDALAQGLGPEQQAEVAVRRSKYALISTYDIPASLAAAQVAHERAQAAGHAGLQAMAYTRWGVVLSHQGQRAEARARFEEAVALARMAGLRSVEASALLYLGNLCDLSDDRTAAWRYLEKGLHLSRETGDRRVEESILSNLSALSSSSGDHTSALAYAEHALGLARQIGYRPGEADELILSGVVYHRLGDYVRAQEYYKQALSIARESGAWYYECKALAFRGRVVCCLGDYDGAQEIGKQALRLAREQDSRELEADGLEILGDVCWALGDPATAQGHYAQALRLWREIGFRGSWSTGSLAGLAWAALAQGDLAQAQACVDEILTILETGGTVFSDFRPFRIYLTCYQVLRASGDPRAAEILNTAHRLLLEQAARLSDEGMRRSFLENVAEKREIVKLGTAPA
jgi:tetratricopeptide (TPR) repeat protein